MNNNTKDHPQKRKKGDETKNRILDIAADLFAHKGYDSVTIHEIADAVGIRESSIYNHFQNKESILDTLFLLFSQKAQESRPSEEELDQMLLIMQPEEIFKNILFYFGNHTNKTVEHAAMVINVEKFRNPRAAEIYFQNVVHEPSEYYERLLRKMIGNGMIKPVDAKLFAEQYNYVSISLTKEYFMAKNGLADLMTVVQYMVKTIHFFCNLMKEQT